MSSSRRSRSRHRRDDRDEDSPSRSYQRHHRSRARSHHRRDDDREEREYYSSRSYHRSRARSQYRREDDRDDDRNASTSRSNHGSRSRSQHHRDDRVEDSRRARHHSSAVATSTSTSASAISGELKTVLRLKQNQIWPRVSGCVYEYLRRVRWDRESSRMIDVDPSVVHSTLISSMVGVGGTVSSSIALQGWIEDNQVDLGSEADNEAERRQEDDHERLLKKIEGDIEIELELEADIILRLLEMMEIKRYHLSMQRSLAMSPIVLRTEQRVVLLELVLWALEQWKTLSTGRSSWEKHKVVKSFEICFVKTAHQIRIESAISSELTASTRSLELLKKMTSIQNRWLVIGESLMTIRLRLACFSGGGQAGLVHKLEDAVEDEVKDKMRRPNSKVEDLIYLSAYEYAMEKLAKNCRWSFGDKSIQGKLIKDMLEFFKSSVALDRRHRDHLFFNTGHMTQVGGLTYKRAVVWIVLGILPHLQENGVTIRLLNTVQHVFREAIDGLSGTEDGKREVSTWRLILEVYLKEEDLTFFYHRVQDRATLEEVGSLEVATNFEYFYPPPSNNGYRAEKLVPFTELLSTTAIPWSKPATTNIVRKDDNPRMPRIAPNVADVEAEVSDFEESPNSDQSNDNGSMDEEEMRYLQSFVSVTTLSMEEKEVDPWEIREINYDDHNVKWEYDNFEDIVDVE